MTAPWVGRAVVYRCFAEDGSLLYIGASSNLEARMDAHVTTSFWRPYVARVRIQIAPDELAARRMEAAAIKAENPRFNIHHRRPRSEWTDQDFIDVIKAYSNNARHVTPSTQRRIESLERELAFRTEGIG